LIDQDFLAAAAMLSSVIEPKAFDSFDSICRLVYSSGTTGNPTATSFSISLIESRVATALENWLLHDSVISVLPMSGITGTLAAYANVALGKTYFAPGNASENFELISNYQIAEVVASPAQLGDLVKNAIAASQNLNSLELIVPAGSMLSEQLAKALLEVAPNARLMNLYGCSELGTIATKREPDFNPANMGRIAPGVEVQIVSQARQVLESGSEGILRFKTTDIAGYFRNPQANSEAFKDGWFYPGDIGFVTPDNHLMLLGRSIEVLNVGGVKINPDQLDGILKTVAGVQDAAAFSYRTPTGTDGLAYAVVEGEGFEPQQLIAAVQETFVALVPTAICSVAQIPRTATSKVLRKALAEAFERNL
jgi:acyl-coenzyme A synthetase/AMP-(fatty) acid ligase